MRDRSAPLDVRRILGFSYQLAALMLMRGRLLLARQTDTPATGRLAGLAV